MSKVRVYFDPDVLPIVDNILEQTGLKSYTDAINLIVKKYGHSFIQSYNEFLTDSTTKPRPQMSSVIELHRLEGFKE